MDRIEKSEYQLRLERLTGIFAGITKHAETQALTRCPYRSAKDQCTAKIRCRHQRQPRVAGEPLICTHDGVLDYRTAWESDPEAVDQMRENLKDSHRSREASADGTAAASVRYGGVLCPVSVGKTLFDHADILAARVPTSCGRTGYCHECIVDVKQGMHVLSQRSEAENFLRDNYRLACQAVIEHSHSDVEFSLLQRSPQILTAQARRGVDLAPMVTRQGDHVCYDGEVIDQYRGNLFGLAIDVGTTTIVAELLDLQTGESRHLTSFENPQRFGGSDVLNRISYDSGEFQGELHRAAINTMNTEIREMCERLQISRHEIYEILVVGNATMRDLFFGLDVQQIGQKPYKSYIELEYLAGARETTALNESARKLRLLANKNARVCGGPLIASHVGSDTAACLAAIDIETCDETVMLVDIGTNTEVVIGNRNRLVAASCPAGPAFEGGLVRYGMPGCEGAIESVRYVDGRFDCRTIGDVPAVGICGSGLIDLLAELRRHELMTPKSVFADKRREFTIVPERDITFSRADASELAQAKGANYSGQYILMREFGVRPDQIDKLCLSGGFANYIDPTAATEIGFLAPVPGERIVRLGNAALQGARELLLSRRRRESIEQFIRRIEHVELETTSDFFDIFVEGCQFKPMPMSDSSAGPTNRW